MKKMNSTLTLITLGTYSNELIVITITTFDHCYILLNQLNSLPKKPRKRTINKMNKPKKDTQN